MEKNTNQIQDPSHEWVWGLKKGDKVWIAIEENITQTERFCIDVLEQIGPSEYMGIEEIFVPYEMEVVNNWVMKSGNEESHILAFEFTIKTLEEDAESLVRHRNRAGIDTASEKMVYYEQEEPVPEVAKALCEEKTAQNATGYDTRHRPKGTLAAGLGQRPNRRGESLRQASASSAWKQLTTPKKYGRLKFATQNKTRDLLNLFGRETSDTVLSTRTFRTETECKAFCQHAISTHYTVSMCESLIDALTKMIGRIKEVEAICVAEEDFHG